MKKLIVIAMLLTVFSFKQELRHKERQSSLLVAEYQKNEGIGNYTYLVSYNFIDGILTSKDTIFSAPVGKGKYQGSYVRYDLGHNFVYKNRYVISGIGNVIDVETKSLVMEESDDLIETRNDSIIFHRNNIITGTGYLICDLKKRTYDFVKDKDFFSVEGLHSPNHLLGLEIDQSIIPYKIILHDKNNKREVIVNDFISGTSLSLYASTMSKIPLYWIDNKYFLYATYSSSGRLMKDAVAKVTIQKVDVETKKSEIIAEIDSIPPAVVNSSFGTNPDKEIIFYCAKGQFKIDLEKKQAISYTMSSMGNNFFIENDGNNDYGRIITFKGDEIGRFWCTYYNAKTTNGFIGVEYGDIGSNLSYPKGVRVWNNITKTWTDIEIPWVAGIIGWVEK